jgi:predicted glycosyltransferase
VILTRHREQREAIARLGLERAVIPKTPLDSRSLVLQASLFLGAGGTMTREAALSGVPTASVFAGEVPAVDSWLEKRGLIVRPRSPAELPDLRPATKATGMGIDPTAAEPILERFVAATEAAGRR